MSAVEIVLLIVCGVLAGVFGGMGMGGGTLLIPLLTFLLGFDQKVCQGLNLVSFLVMAIVTLFIHFKNGLIKTEGIGYIIASGVVFSCLGALLAGALSSKLLRILFGAFLCVLAIIELVKAIKDK